MRYRSRLHTFWTMLKLCRCLFLQCCMQLSLHALQVGRIRCAQRPATCSTTSAHTRQSQYAAMVGVCIYLYVCHTLLNGCLLKGKPCLTLHISLDHLSMYQTLRHHTDAGIELYTLVAWRLSKSGNITVTYLWSVCTTVLTDESPADVRYS